MKEIEVIKYLVCGDVGLSAKTLLGYYFFGKSYKQVNHPYDLSDLSRCFNAYYSLDIVSIDYMKEIKSKEWVRIADNWFKLIKLYNTDKNECMSLLNECIRYD